ncbi:hypothetical protein [Gelidibacter mesophilus]|uniref:hypothetical protein n=1 Tax=Gelidibacter mesophilus TaxID=169050 RepID=UPI000418AA62|nr:hypothetical protein [Gelidibacter mesophilus]
MKTLLIYIIILCSTPVFAQFPSASVTDPNIKVQADRITEDYSKHLALTGVQIPLFKNKVAHYLVLAQDIKTEKEGREQLDALVEMQAEESLAMNDILTLQQYRLYKKLKTEIQSLKMVE